MPKATKKSKKKPTRRVKRDKPMRDKSIHTSASAKKGAAQAQTTNVVVKIGNRRRAPATPKPPTSMPPNIMPRPDGWYPYNNLMRNGTEIRYVNVPTPATSNLLAGTPTAPPTFTETAVSKESGFDAVFAPEETSSESPYEPDSGFNMTEFLAQSKNPQPKRLNYFDEGEDATMNEDLESFAPPAPRQKTLVLPISRNEPSFINTSSIWAADANDDPADAEVEAESQLPQLNRIELLNEIEGIARTLEREGVMKRRGTTKTKFINDVFGEFGKYKGTPKKYSQYELGIIRENIRNKYNR